MIYTTIHGNIEGELIIPRIDVLKIKDTNCERCGKLFQRHANASEVIYCSNICYIASKVRINDITGCWDWLAGTDGKGYGQCSRGGIRAAHRLAYQTYIADIPKNYSILHKCDRPICCNPDHLFLGTQQDNLADMRSKRRGAKGETHGSCKLTEEQVTAILVDPRLRKEIAIEYNISPSRISAIKNGKSWTHLLRGANAQ